MTRDTLRKKLPVAGAVLAAGAVLFFCNPAEYRLFPPCLFHSLTGLLCPGCGATRALHQLLHGHVIAATHCNALLILSLPVLAGLAARFVRQRWRGEKATPQWHGWWTWAFLGTMLIFAVWRNLPSGAWLSP